MTKVPLLRNVHTPNQPHMHACMQSAKHIKQSSAGTRKGRIVRPNMSGGTKALGNRTWTHTENKNILVVTAQVRIDAENMQYTKICMPGKSGQKRGKHATASAAAKNSQMSGTNNKMMPPRELEHGDTECSYSRKFLYAKNNARNTLYRQRQMRARRSQGRYFAAAVKEIGSQSQR